MKKIFYLIICLCSFSFLACENNSSSSFEKKEEVDPNFVSIVEVDSIASLIDLSAFMTEGASTRKKSQLEAKTIDEIVAVPDESGNTVYYIVNYESEGFVIISADNRVEPILAFSETSRFPLDEALYPEGLVGWLFDKKEMVRDVREENLQQTEELSLAWGKGLSTFMVEDLGPEDIDLGEGCPDNSFHVSIPLETKWGQNYPYNSLLPYCNDGRQALAGCVATAMAQVMKYNKYPNTYNWDAMPDKYGTSETAILMKDIGKAVDMDYGCDGSGAKMANVAPALIEKFGYSSAKFGNFDLSKLIIDLGQNRPVILSGGRKSGWWIFSSYKDGHAWVCSGYKTTSIWNGDCSVGYSGQYLWMNWGWDGRYNAWYGLGDWSAGGHSFNYEKKMIYNIVP